ncbi:hypothetical protein FM076_13855 [Streptomyces albus subsp. chlorinus]|nr:hypothetical protein [Streptomyces albus subsp. chlorinus]
MTPACLPLPVPPPAGPSRTSPAGRRGHIAMVGIPAVSHALPGLEVIRQGAADLAGACVQRAAGVLRCRSRRCLTARRRPRLVVGDGAAGIRRGAGHAAGRLRAPAASRPVAGRGGGPLHRRRAPDVRR